MAQVIGEALKSVDSWASLGSALTRLRRLRGHSLRSAAGALEVSKSRLHRREQGEGWSPDDTEFVKRLDRMLDTQGLILESFRRVSGTDRPVRSKWVHHFPAEHVGLVYLWLQPERENVGGIHRLMMRWGPWEVRLHDRPPQEGALWWFTKGDDGLSVPLFVQISPAATLEFAVANLWNLTPQNANHGWTRWE